MYSWYLPKQPVKAPTPDPTMSSPIDLSQLPHCYSFWVPLLCYVLCSISFQLQFREAIKTFHFRTFKTIKIALSGRVTAGEHPVQKGRWPGKGGSLPLLLLPPPQSPALLPGRGRGRWPRRRAAVEWYYSVTFAQLSGSTGFCGLHVLYSTWCCITITFDSLLSGFSQCFWLMQVTLEASEKVKRRPLQAEKY